MDKKYFFFISILFTLSSLITNYSCYQSDLNNTVYNNMDSESPIELAINIPENNQVLYEDFKIVGIAQSPHGIASIQLKIDNYREYTTNLKNMWVAPYDLSSSTTTLLDINSFNPGNHIISVVAFDKKGFTKTVSNTFVIPDLLGLSIKSPSDEQLFLNLVPILVSGTYNALYKPVRTIEVWLDNYSNPLNTQINPDLTWNATFSAQNLDAGSHIIYSRLFDGYGTNINEANVVTSNRKILISDDVLNINISSPENMNCVAGNVNISGFAVSLKTPFTVEVKIDDGLWTPVACQDMWNYTWDTSYFQIGIHRVTAKITDVDGKTKENFISLRLLSLSIEIISPIDNQVFRTPMCTFEGTYISSQTVKTISVYFDDIGPYCIPFDQITHKWSILLSPEGHFPFSFQPNVGYHVLKAKIEDVLGNVAEDSVIIHKPQCEQIAVILGDYDRIEDILYELGYSSYITFVQESILNNGNSLNSYCKLFINCDSYNSVAYSASANANIQSYIYNGNSLYVSDWAFQYVDSAFPGKIDFTYPYAGDSTFVPINPTQWANVPIECSITDNGLAMIVGNFVDITFDWDSWIVYTSTAPNVKTYVKGNITINSSTTSLYNVPLLSSFMHGDGTVVYTSFHNEINTTPDMIGVIKYIINYMM